MAFFCNFTSFRHNVFVIFAIVIILDGLVPRDNDEPKRHGFALHVQVGFQVELGRKAQQAQIQHGTALVDAFRVPVEEKELLVDVLETVLVVIDLPFGIAVVFLTVKATVVVDIAFKTRAFLIALIPFAAEGAALNALPAVLF